VRKEENTMEIEILKKFCGTDYPEWIMEPWNQDGYTYATDGHVIVRMISSSHGEGITLPPILGERETAIIKKLPWSTLAKRSTFSRLLPGTFNAVRERFLCRKCVPDAALAKPCTKCEGKDSGEDCLACGGVGLEKEKGQEQWKTSQCPECDGTRWAEKTVWCLRNHEDVDKRYYLNPRILQKMIENLGPIDFVEPEEIKPVGFRFAGGDGLLMPMRPAPWHEAVNLIKGEIPW
jgi:hypothetical protein